MIRHSNSTDGQIFYIILSEIESFDYDVFYERTRDLCVDSALLYPFASGVLLILSCDIVC